MTFARYREEARKKEDELKNWNDEWNESIRTSRNKEALYLKYLTEIDAIFSELRSEQTSFLIHLSQNPVILRENMTHYQMVLKNELNQFTFWFEETNVHSVQPDKFRHVMLAARALQEWNRSAQHFASNPDTFYQKQQDFQQKATDSGLSPRAKIAGIVITTNFIVLAILIGLLAMAGFPIGGSVFLLGMIGIFGYGFVGKEAYEHYKPVIKSNQAGGKVSAVSMFKKEDELKHPVSNLKRSRFAWSVM